MLTALGCLAAKTIGTDGTNRGYQRMHEHEWAFHHVNKLALMPKIGAVFGQEEDLQMIFARELAAAAVTSISGRYPSRAGPRIRAGSADHARGSSCGHSHEHELRIGARWHCADRRDEGRSTRRLHRAAGQEEGARQKDVAAASMDTTPTC